MNNQISDADKKCLSVCKKLGITYEELIDIRNDREEIKKIYKLIDDILARMQQDDLTTLSLLERVTRLERMEKHDESKKLPKTLNMLQKMTYSQSGEDAILAYMLAVLGIPFFQCTYLDLGANRPKEMSNTYFFYEQGANGTLVEANPSLIPALEKERKGDTIVNKCIAPVSGRTIDFNILSIDGLSAPGDISGILAENPEVKLLKTIPIETICVNDLIKQMDKVPVILNIDIEGMELEILKSIDFSKYRPLVIILEMIPYSTKLPVGNRNIELLDFMQNVGYAEYAFSGINSIFIDLNKYKLMTGEK